MSSKDSMEKEAIAPIISSEKLKNVDWDNVLKSWGGAAALGGGTATVISLLRYLNALAEEKEEVEDTSYDDDVLYLNLGKEASTKEGAAPGEELALSGIGSLLAAFLAYKTVNSIYNKTREKQLQRELDMAQQVYLQNLGEESELKKSSSKKKPYTKLDKAYALMLAASAAIPLGSGIIAYNLLKQYDPVVKGKKSVKPKRIVIRSNKSDKSKKEEVPTLPDNTELPTGEPSPEEIENLLRLAMEKPASVDEGLLDVISYIADGGLEKASKITAEHDIFTLFDKVKGYRNNNVDEMSKLAAVRVASNSPVLSQPLGLIAASEYYDMAPNFVKMATSLSEVDQALLRGAVREFTKIQFADSMYKEAGQEEDLEKSALSEVEILLGLRSLLAKKKELNNSEDSEDDLEENLQVQESLESTDVEADGEAASEFLEENKDIIDGLLSKS